MRTALLLVTFAVMLFTGCKDDKDACDGACSTTDAKYGIGDRAIIAVDQHTFDAFDGRGYTLVRVEYGADSVYCGFVVGGDVYPVYADFQTDEDVLFDEDEDLTGLDLPIFDDEDFDAWLWDTDADDDILIACFD